MDFDRIIPRIGTHSVKWDGMQALYGIDPAHGLPMWVADMDFMPPASVQAAVERMEHGAAIINTGSITGIDGNPKLLDYSMTKGGIHAFTRALAGNLVSRGIRVNCVAPGPVWTPLNPSDRDAEEVSQFGAQTKMKRPAQPEELSPVFVFLASPVMSSYVNGIVLPVMGGPKG